MVFRATHLIAALCLQVRKVQYLKNTGKLTQITILCWSLIATAIFSLTISIISWLASSNADPINVTRYTDQVAYEECRENALTQDSGLPGALELLRCSQDYRYIEEIPGEELSLLEYISIYANDFLLTVMYLGIYTFLFLQCANFLLASRKTGWKRLSIVLAPFPTILITHFFVESSNWVVDGFFTWVLVMLFSTGVYLLSTSVILGATYLYDWIKKGFRD